MKNRMLLMNAMMSLHTVMDMGFLPPARPSLGIPGLAMKDGDGMEGVMAELGSIETRLSKKLDDRLTQIKEGSKVPDQDAEIKRLESEHKAAGDELRGMIGEIEKKLGRVNLGGPGEAERKSSGQVFTEAEEFKNRGSGRFSITVEQKALTSAAASAGSLLEIQRLPMYEIPTEPHIRDLIPSGTTSSKSLKFPQRKLRTNNAAMVAEGAAKPQSDFTFEMKTWDVKKIAHYIKASDEILEDEPALRSYIDAQLIDGLRDVEDAQILKGDGTGQNLLGLYTVAQAFTRVVAGDTLLDKLMRAPTQLRLVNRTATGYVLNPEDWEAIMLLKGTDSHYIWLNVMDGNGQPRLLAKPVRDSTKLAKGEWLVGDFRRGAQLYDRQQSNVTVANQNEDDFIKNMVTILAEERIALVIYDALSFVKNAPTV